MCCVHGDETASLVICTEFVKQIRNTSIKGKISFITAANPFAQAARTRGVVSDFYDLNRMGRGKVDGVLTERLAYKLCEFLLGSSFVIDIHEFEMKTPTMAIYIPSTSQETNTQILRGICAFNPSTVWAMNLENPDEVKYTGSILAVLIGQGIPGFAVETSRITELKSTEIQKAVKGLVEVAKVLGILEGESKFSSPRAYIRNINYSDRGGIWQPKAKLLSQVKEGDKIGEIISINLNEKIDVIAKIGGTLIQLRTSDLVNTGTSLFTIGVKDKSVSKKIANMV
jgi:predicted deacylase